MIECTSCSKKGISILRLSLSDSASPTKCRFCGEMYYLSGMYRNTLFLIFNILIPLGFFTSILASSWWPIVIVVGAGLISFCMASYSTTPIQTDIKSVKKSSFYKSSVITVMFLLVIAATVYEYTN